MQISPELRQAIESIVGTSLDAEISSAAAGVSQRYRRIREAGTVAAPLQIQSEHEAKSYLAYRFPATFCAATSVLKHVQQIMPDLAPTSLLDVGAGPATATLAALSFWPGIEKATLIEPNAHLRNVGGDLVKKTHPDANISWLAQKIGGVPIPTPAKHDVVIMGYMLNEIADEMGEDALDRILEEIWPQTGELLIILEPGTPFGQKAVLRARENLLKKGAKLVAPCPHEKPCPIAAQFPIEQRWCHFSVRVERSKLHKRAKENATLGYEDEKFSYVAFAKTDVALPQARLIGTPRGKKVIHAELCRADGTIQHVVVAKSSPDHNKLRSASWGDSL